jgi:hypothetical protein
MSICDIITGKEGDIDFCGKKPQKSISPSFPSLGFDALITLGYT